eukprot:1944625-Pleurochrysis_carterae.AAC.1
MFMLKLAKVRLAKEVSCAAHYFAECRSRVRTDAAEVSNLFSHQIERDRPSKRRPPTARVIATVKSQERILRRALHPED